MRLIDARKLKSAIWGITELSYQQKVIVEAHIDGEPAANEWIPVTERLPNNYEMVLLTAKMLLDSKWLVYMGVREGNKFKLCGVFNSQDYKVISWMPLPEPYEGGENND